jgi:enoyl-CoA hydratase
MISAEEAQRIGLVNHVYEPPELMPAAAALARKFAANAPMAIRLAMEAIRRGAQMPLEEGLALEATLFAMCCGTADMAEGTRAFLEKRPARFQGR